MRPVARGLDSRGFLTGNIAGQETGTVLGPGQDLTPGGAGRGPPSFCRPLRPVPRSPAGAGGVVSWAAGGPRPMGSRSPPEGPSSGGSRGGGFPRRGGSSGGRPPPTERRMSVAPTYRTLPPQGPKAFSWTRVNCRGTTMCWALSKPSEYTNSQNAQGFSHKEGAQLTDTGTQKG